MSATKTTPRAYSPTSLHAAQQRRYARITQLTDEITALATADQGGALGAALDRLTQLRRHEIYAARPAHRGYLDATDPTTDVATAAGVREADVRAIWDGPPVPPAGSASDLVPPPSKAPANLAERARSSAETEELEAEQQQHYAYVEQLDDFSRQLEAEASAARSALYEAMYQAFPERRGWGRLHGSATALQRITGLSTEQLRKIRGGKLRAP